jgi:hypothetical protein
MDETRMTADLPNLDVEIVHRALPEERAEVMTISLKATPSFDAVSRHMAGPLALAAFNPVLAWAAMAQAAWAPLLGAMAAWTPAAPPLARRGRPDGGSQG